MGMLCWEKYLKPKDVEKGRQTIQLRTQGSPWESLEAPFLPPHCSLSSAQPGQGNSRPWSLPTVTLSYSSSPSLGEGQGKSQKETWSPRPWSGLLAWLGADAQQGLGALVLSLSCGAPTSQKPRKMLNYPLFTSEDIFVNSISAPLFPSSLSLMVALSVTLPVLGLLIAGGLLLIWKHSRDKEKLLLQLKWSRAQLHKVDVTLDPDTAHPQLILSEDWKQVIRGDTLQDLPDNPKRIDVEPCVLGRKGFTTGRHCWEVEVGDNSAWGLGICRENVGRKGDIIMSPENGIWAVALWGQYQAFTSPLTPLSLTTRPRRVVVYLDYEAGDISFFSGTDGSHIYSFTHATFSGTLLPGFCLLSNHPTPLTICPVPGVAEGEADPDPGLPILRRS
ncbi:butyrophilin subfamily 1 member A1-like [Ornithorhynchus anatinus]|uniref:butyrophilin subfamily 1 member A1-like n=1 Tax=Ornithorhynchus anatinus TaxID=9258 RepID=UPI0019D4D02F|nr:butyrophilin subfamily 1 member A1-like [Ornithorhynchus anatinus]